MFFDCCFNVIYNMYVDTIYMTTYAFRSLTIAYKTVTNIIFEIIMLLYRLQKVCNKHSLCNKGINKMFTK